VVRVSVIIVALALGVGASACGRTDDRRQVGAVVRSFVGAYEAGDGEKACGRLSSDTVKALESQEGKPCAQAVTELQLDGGAVSEIELYVTNAKVELTTGESMFLSDESDGWRLAAVGCRPEAGKPADRPFECMAEA
jgi:hypothetical protein